MPYFRAFCFSCIFISSCFSAAFAAERSNAASDGRQSKKYRSLTPIFDDSLKQKKLFELSIENAEIGKGLQSGEAIVDLHADSNVLQAGVSEIERLSEIKTLEYGIKSQFYVDYRKLEARYAPDLSRAMSAHLKEAKARAKELVDAAEPQMDRAMKAAQANKKQALPEQEPKKQLSASALSEFELELEKSKARQAAVSRNAAAKIDAALANASTGKLQMAEMPKLKLVFPQTSANTSHEAMPPAPANKTVSARKIDPGKEQEKGAGRQADLDTYIKLAQKQVTAKLQDASNDLNLLRTELKALPRLKLPEPGKRSAASQQQLESRKEEIDWDKWHADFAVLAREPLLRFLRDAGSPAGANTVEITVSAKRELSLRLVKESNPAFDQAIINAYNELDANPGLDFPEGSRRKTISFLIDNKHEGPGLAAKVSSQTKIGDREILIKQK